MGKRGFIAQGREVRHSISLIFKIMKKITSTLLLLVLGFAAAAQIPNGDFESWTETSKDQLKGWNRNGRHDKTVGPNSSNAVKIITENDNSGVIAYVVMGL